MRAPFRTSPNHGWHDEDPDPVYAPYVEAIVEDKPERPHLLDHRGRPIRRPAEPFGFHGSPRG